MEDVEDVGDNSSNYTFEAACEVDEVGCVVIVTVDLLKCKCMRKESIGERCAVQDA